MLGPKTGAIVAGGAAGIGHAACLALAEHGRAIAVWDVQADAARATAAECEARYGVQAHVEVVDLGDQGAVEGAVASSVPAGSGLSSSAALEVSVALALCAAAGLELDEKALALACQDAEHRATGVPSGIMDQLASVAGRAGHALLIDCRTLDVRHVAIPPDAALLVVHSGLRRTLETSEYAARRAECERTARDLGPGPRRDAPPEQVADEPLTRHVVSENGRVHASAEALERGDLARVGELFLESHASLRDDYRVSTPELDTLVDAIVAAGAAGARLTGAGFGGCVVAVAPRDSADEILRSAVATYRAKTGLPPMFWVCEPTSGAGPLEPPSPTP